MCRLSLAVALLQLVLLGGFNFVTENQAQRTYLEDLYLDIWRPLRLIGLTALGRTGELPNYLKRAKMLNKTQTTFSKDARFCEAPNGAGRRSAVRPSSVHELRPGDIDVIGAMGDSLTAGTAAFAASMLHLPIENRGTSFSIGGRGSWTQYLTLPNMIKEFNPNLYGYSTRDGLTIERHSKFNVAEPAGMSRDMPYMARILTKRMRRDPRVNMTHDWKLVTMFIGSNDVCSEFCYAADPDKLLVYFESSMVRTYRFLRDNVPRLLLNVIQVPNLFFLSKLQKLPPLCELTMPGECPCLTGLVHKSKRPIFARILKQWWAKDLEIVKRPEFNTETFTINYHTFLNFDEFFKQPDGGFDASLLAVDCFHLSQKGHSLVAQFLWNSMFEPPYNKTQRTNETLSEILGWGFRCPTETQPYFLTRNNAVDT